MKFQGSASQICHDRVLDYVSFENLSLVIHGDLRGDRFIRLAGTERERVCEIPACRFNYDKIVRSFGDHALSVAEVISSWPGLFSAACCGVA
jgi:hypothetical protein